MIMRVVEVEVLGKKYDLTYSIRVQMKMEKEKWDMESAEGVCSLLSAMMEAGDKLAKLEGREGKGFLTVDEMADRLDPAEFMRLVQSMNEAQQGERNVEAVDDPKNAESAPSAS